MLAEQCSVSIRSGAPIMQERFVSSMQSSNKPADVSPVDHGERHLRADAQRSVDALIAAATELFATTGVDATTREIADRAGVGMGTLYRRFPRRADLIVAVFRHEMNACVEAADALSTKYPPFEALVRWMQIYAEFVGKKRGLAKAVSSGDPVFSGLLSHFDQHLRPAAQKLFTAAVLTGDVRPDTDAAEILCAVSNLCMSTYDQKADHAANMTALLIAGLRLR